MGTSPYEFRSSTSPPPRMQIRKVTRYVVLCPSMHSKDHEEKLQSYEKEKVIFCKPVLFLSTTLIIFLPLIWPLNTSDSLHSSCYTTTATTTTTAVLNTVLITAATQAVSAHLSYTKRDLFWFQDVRILCYMWLE